MTESNIVVAIDSNIIVWGVRDVNKRKLSKKDREKSERCQWLFWDLKERKATIVLPSIAVSEVLRGVEPSRQQKFSDKLQTYFLLSPFDHKASQIAGQLWHERLRSMTAHPDPSAKIKADMLIVASAKSAGASAFYSDDQGALKIASLVMDARGLPTSKPMLFEK